MIRAPSRPAVTSQFLDLHLLLPHLCRDRCVRRRRCTGRPRHALSVCYAQEEAEHGERWMIMKLVYFETYERRDGRWYFVRRKVRSWYSTEWTDRPNDPHRWTPSGQPPREGDLPAYWTSWHAF